MKQQLNHYLRQPTSPTEVQAMIQRFSDQGWQLLETIANTAEDSNLLCYCFIKQ